MPNGDLKEIYEAVNKLSDKITGIGVNVKNLGNDVTEIKSDIKDVKSCLDSDRIKIALLENNTKTVEDMARDKFDKLGDVEREASKIKSLEKAIDDIKQSKNFWTDKAIYVLMTVLGIGTSIGIALMK